MRCDNCPLYSPRGEDDVCPESEGEYGLEHKDGVWGCKHPYNWAKVRADEYAEHLGREADFMALELKIDFLQKWKDDVVNSLGKYDANSVEEVYRYGNIRGNIEMLNGAKSLFKLAMSEKPNRTINECEAMIIFKNLEEQMKSQKTSDKNKR